jgi:hypothetical protein
MHRLTEKLDEVGMAMGKDKSHVNGYGETATLGLSTLSPRVQTPEMVLEF